MPRVAVDLHIHSCLSPCGDALMTPNNIARMAMLKGLDLIAVTDHNTARQLPAVEAVCREIGLKLVPGMELTTREEVHLLAYFRTVREALAFSEEVYAYLPDVPNRAAYFGAQTVMDERDEATDEEPKLLISALGLSLDQLTERVLARGGVPVPAHINRGSNGLLNVLGFLPPGARFPALEVARGLPCPGGLDGKKLLRASDAHRLEDMLEREEFLELERADADAFWEWMQG